MANDTPDRAHDNQRHLRRLVLSIQASYGRLNLLIALSDNWKHRDELIHHYEAELQAKGAHCYRVRMDRQQPSLKQCLLELTEQAADWHREQAMVTVLGADELLGVRLQHGEKSSQEKFFFSLQWTREALRHYQLPIVLWLTPPIARQLAQLAPDFWSWRGGVFEFSRPIAQTLPEIPQSTRRSITDHPSDASTAIPEDIERQIAELKAQDAESPLLASLYMELGAAYETAVRYAEATTAYEQAVQLREAQLGADHLDTATSLNDLATLYDSMGRYGEAEPLYQRALEIFEAKLGPDHPDTAISLNNLAELYRAMGRYGDAEPLHKRALEIDEAQLGPDHPDTATDLNNLALLYHSTGRYGEAEPLYVGALAIHEAQLGPDHPATATSLNNLAGLYDSMGRYGEAEPLYIRSLAICEAQLGPDHLDTASSLNNLAWLYDSMGRYGEAEPLYVRAIAIWEKSLPPEHPYISTGKANFRRLLQAAIDANQTDQLSDHPRTQALLRELQSS